MGGGVQSFHALSGHIALPLLLGVHQSEALGSPLGAFMEVSLFRRD